MDRSEVKKVAVRLNNPALLKAFERMSVDRLSWEEAINEAAVELARQNDYFLNRLINSHQPDSPAKSADRPTAANAAATTPAVHTAKAATDVAAEEAPTKKAAVSM